MYKVFEGSINCACQWQHETLWKRHALDRRRMPHTWSWRFKAFMQQTLHTKASVLAEFLRLDVQRRALLQRGETLDLQGRTCLLDSLNPRSDRAGIPLLGSRARLLTH